MEVICYENDNYLKRVRRVRGSRYPKKDIKQFGDDHDYNQILYMSCEWSIC